MKNIDLYKSFTGWMIHVKSIIVANFKTHLNSFESIYRAFILSYCNKTNTFCAETWCKLV